MKPRHNQPCNSCAICSAGNIREINVPRKPLSPTLLTDFAHARKIDSEVPVERKCPVNTGVSASFDDGAANHSDRARTYKENSMRLATRRCASRAEYRSARRAHHRGAFNAL